MDCIEPDLPMVDICKSKPNCRLKGNVFCNDIRSMRFFLHAFSAMRHDKHCLAFAFTYREMSDFQGIAWIKVNNSKDKCTIIQNLINENGRYDTIKPLLILTSYSLVHFQLHSIFIHLKTFFNLFINSYRGN